MFPSKLRRRLYLELLEPRWTMDASICPAFPATPTTDACADVQAVEQSLNQFALDLYRTISGASTGPTDEAISPFSIAAALAMTYAGASGETANQLAHALHVDLPPDRFHAAMGTILQDILPDDSDSTTQLEIADALWGQKGFPFLDSFRQLIHDRYGADFHEADFKNAADEATAEINDWVKTQTHEMIKQLFDSLSPATRLVLVNALYFKANWAAAFDPSSTQRTVFHLANGASMDVSMMNRGGYFNYTETSDYQIAELPYEDGRYSMIVLLPKQADVDLAVNFSATDLQNWLAELHSADLSFELPKFKVDTSMSLIGTLQSLGVADAFDGSVTDALDRTVADFSGIAGQRNLYISQAVHKAKVEVDETGSKAAAVTGIAINLVTTTCWCPSSAPIPIPFYADHPFHFLIRDRLTNSILFMGQVQQPTAYDGSDPTATELPKFTIVGLPTTTPITKPPKITIDPTKIVSPVTTNPFNPFDVNGDGQETPSDALAVINYLNDPSSASPIQQTAFLITSKFYADVDGDGIIAPRDVLILINRLNELDFSAVPDHADQEGESPAVGQPFDAAAIDLLLGLGDLATISNRPATRYIV